METAFFDRLNVAVVIADASDNVCYLNKVAGEMRGVSGDDDAEVPIQRVLPFMRDESVRAAIRKTVDAGAEWNCTVFDREALDCAGAVRWTLMGVRCPEEPEPRLLAMGEPVLGVATGSLLSIDDDPSDVADKALRYAERRFLTAISTGRAGIWEFSIISDAFYISPNLMTLLGYAPDEIPNTFDAWTDLSHPDDLARAADEAQYAFQGKQPVFECEVRKRHKDGSYRWMLTRGRVVRDDEGDPIGLIGIDTDITEMKQVEEDLAESRYALAQAQQIAQIGSWSRDLESGEIRWSDQQYRNLGHEPDDPVVVNWDVWMAAIHPEDREPFEQAFRDTRESGLPFDLEYRTNPTAGPERTIRSRGELIRDPRNRPGRLIGVDQDVTELSKLNRERTRLDEKIRQTQKLEGLAVLAGGIAHDFNNLLVGIIGNAELVRDDLPPESPDRTLLTEIEDAGKRAAALSLQMLTYSGRGQFITRPVDAGRLIRKIAHVVNSVVGEQVVVQMDLEPGEIRVEADEKQIGQAIINLATNAAEAVETAESAGGEITLRTRTSIWDREALRATYIDDELPSGRYVSIEVEDNGVGMDAATLPKIFDPFFSTKFTGRGLGLAAVLGIVRGHRGAIRVESQVGRGSTFAIVLPALPSAEAVEEKRAERAAPQPSSVLVVDDEFLVRNVAWKVLTREGFDVTTVEDGVAAVELVDREPERYDCVLLDVTMPRMGGLKALVELLRIRLDLPIVVSSGHAKAEVLADFAGLPIAGFLQKPYGASRLVDAVFGALEASEPAEEKKADEPQ